VVLHAVGEVGQLGLSKVTRPVVESSLPMFRPNGGSVPSTASSGSTPSACRIS
jgi:hypothetical protein